MKRQTTIIIMRIIEVIAETTDHTEVNEVAENPLEGPNKGEGDNKTIKGANTKTTMEAITIIIITVIIEAEVVTAMVVTITEGTAMDKAVIKAITITNTINIAHMMMAHRWSNMVHHVHFAMALITLLSNVLKESIT